jgi:hypothetical protein
MLTGLEWVLVKAVVVEVVEADAPSVLVIDVECLNLNVDAKREDVLSAKGGHFVSP